MTLAFRGLLGFIFLPMLWYLQAAETASAAPAYKLPWMTGQRIFVLQGTQEGSHLSSSTRNAYDYIADPLVPDRFAVPRFMVRASRSGRAAKVVNQFTDSSDCDPSYNFQANYILLDHGDGMGTLYLHLAQDSIIPREGAWVHQGDPLALTGHTGYICGPAHLHFTVLDIDTWRSLDVPFAD